MNYFEWAREYDRNAAGVLQVIERLKTLYREPSLSADRRKTLSDNIAVYRCILREQRQTADLLRARAQRYPREA